MGAAAMPIMIGMGVGAMTNRDDPLKGAAIGGALGYGGSAMMSGMSAAGSQAGMTGAGGYMGNNLALPTVGGSGSLSGMAAQQAAQQAAIPGMSMANPMGLQFTGGGMTAAPSANYLAGGSLSGTGQVAPGWMNSAAPMQEPGLLSSMRSYLPEISEEGRNTMQAGQAMAKLGQPQQQQPQPRMPIVSAPMNRPEPRPISSPYENRPMGYTYGQPSILPGFRG